MSKSPIYSSSLKCIKVHSTFMHFNELEQIPSGIQSSGMKNFGGGKQFFGRGLFHFIEVEWSGIQLELVGHMKDLDDIGPVQVKTESHDWKSGSPWDNQMTSSFANAIAMAMSQMNQGQQDQGCRAPRNKTSLSPGLALLQNALSFLFGWPTFHSWLSNSSWIWSEGIAPTKSPGYDQVTQWYTSWTSSRHRQGPEEKNRQLAQSKLTNSRCPFRGGKISQASTFNAVINSTNDSDDNEEESYPGALIREVEDVENLQIFAVAAQQKADEAAKKLSEKAKTYNTWGKGKAPVNQASAKNSPSSVAKADSSTPNAPVPMGQFKYQMSAENPKILQWVMEKFLKGEVTLTTEEMLAASSELRKHTQDIVTPCKVTAGTNLYNAGASNSVSVNVANDGMTTSFRRTTVSHSMRLMWSSRMALWLKL